MQRSGYCRSSRVNYSCKFMNQCCSPNQLASDVITRLVPTRLHHWTMLIPPLTLVCFFGISGLWLQDRSIRQLKEEAQHVSKLGVQHIMWGLDGLVLACLWRLCILSDTVLVFSVLVFLLLRRCLSYWLCYVQKLSNRSRGRACPRHLHGLQCSVVLPI